MTTNDQLSFNSIEVFVAIVEEQSVTKAAKRFGFSVSTASNHLAKLEKALAAKLIKRSAHRFELTNAGRMFLVRAQSILDEVTMAKAEFTSKGYSASMYLRIAVIEDFDQDILPIWLRKLRDEYPNCTFDIQSGTSHESHSALYSRKVDVIIAADSATYIDDIDEHQISLDPYLLVASKSASSEKTIDDLIKHPFVRYSRDQLIAKQIEAQLRRSGINPKQTFECTSTAAVLSLVEEFNGWSIVPLSALLGTVKIDEALSQNLIYQDLPIPNFSRTISLYARSGTLDDIPTNISVLLKETLQSILIEKAKIRLPFIANRIRVK